MIGALDTPEPEFQESGHYHRRISIHHASLNQRQLPIEQQQASLNLGPASELIRAQPASNPAPGTRGPKFSWYLGWPVAVMVAKVRPWKDWRAVTITGSSMPSFVCAYLRAAWIGAGHARGEHDKRCSQQSHTARRRKPKANHTATHRPAFITCATNMIRARVLRQDIRTLDLHATHHRRHRDCFRVVTPPPPRPHPHCRGMTSIYLYLSSHVATEVATSSMDNSSPLQDSVSTTSSE